MKLRLIKSLTTKEYKLPNRSMDKLSNQSSTLYGESIDDALDQAVYEKVNKMERIKRGRGYQSVLHLTDDEAARLENIARSESEYWFDDADPYLGKEFSDLSKKIRKRRLGE